MTDATTSRKDIDTNNVLCAGSTPTGTPDLTFVKASGEDAANEEQLAREAVTELVATGKLSANAPCDGMHNDWSDESKANFRRALGKMFGFKSETA